MKIKFSVRDVLWLILLVAVNLGWYMHKVAPTRALEEQLASQRKQTESCKEQMKADMLLFINRNEEYNASEKKYLAIQAAFMTENTKVHSENYRLKQNAQITERMNKAIVEFCERHLDESHKQSVHNMVAHFSDMAKPYSIRE
jgi:hypothetical protein